MKKIHGLFALLSAVSLPSLCECSCESKGISIDFDDWLKLQTKTNLQNIMANIGPDGKNAINTDPGCVIASPSRSDPGYFYQWTRDSSLTYDLIIDQFIQGEDSYAKTIFNFLNEMQKLQTTTNPSGSFETGGLGEPKFHVNGSAFTGEWGRPQRDGPALRAVALIKFADYLKDKGEMIPKGLYSVADYSVIKADLEYVASTWNQTSFDVWEEINGIHFFTLSVSRRALKAGSLLAHRLGDEPASTFYSDVDKAVLHATQAFWNETAKYVKATRDPNGRSMLDASVLLGSLYGESNYSPWSNEILSTVVELNTKMGSLYPINEPYTKTRGVALGRYPEDVYDGIATSNGHPWFLTTAAAAHVIYEAVDWFSKSNDLSNISEDVLVALTGLEREQFSLDRILPRMVHFADGYLRIIQSFVFPNGSLSEQFDRQNATQRGAHDLTWSYVEVTQAILARQKLNQSNLLPPPDLQAAESTLCPSQPEEKFRPAEAEKPANEDRPQPSTSKVGHPYKGPAATFGPDSRPGMSNSSSDAAVHGSNSKHGDHNSEAVGTRLPAYLWSVPGIFFAAFFLG